MKKKADLEIELRDCIKLEMEQKETEMLSKMKTNPRALFYTYAKKNGKTYSSVGPLTDENNKQHTDPTEMCNLL